MNRLKLLFYVKDIVRPIVLTYTSNDSEEKVQEVITKILETKKIFQFKSNVTSDIIILRSSDIKCVLVTKTTEKELEHEPNNDNSNK